MRHPVLITIFSVIGALVVATLALVGIFMLIFNISGCTPRPVAWPISSSHAQLTATEYDDAENHFADVGNMVPPTGWTAAECQALLDKRDRASAFQLGLASLGGGAGLATLIPKDATEEEQRAWNLGLGITALATGGTAVVLGSLIRSWSATYERNCNTRDAPDPSVVEHPAGDEREPDGGAE